MICFSSFELETGGVLLHFEFLQSNINHVYHSDLIGSDFAAFSPSGAAVPARSCVRCLQAAGFLRVQRKSSRKWQLHQLGLPVSLFWCFDAVIWCYMKEARLSHWASWLNLDHGSSLRWHWPFFVWLTTRGTDWELFSNSPAQSVSGSFRHSDHFWEPARWSASPGLYHLVCTSWPVSPGVYFLVRISWSVFPDTYLLVCIFWSVLQLCSSWSVTQGQHQSPASGPYTKD